jgi:hypothetical protein
MTGIYLTVDSYGSGGPLSSDSGPVTATTFDVHGTGPGNELNAIVNFVNNVPGDFVSPQATSALEALRIRCQDPSGTASYSVACTLDISSGQASCSPGCYSAASGIIKMQVQVDPAGGQSGQVRIGIDPSSVNICDDQSGTPIYVINP